MPATMTRPLAAFCLLACGAGALRVPPMPTAEWHVAEAPSEGKCPGVDQGATCVAMQNEQNIDYLGPITIGGQSFKAIYDTGSFQVLTLSTLCGHCYTGEGMSIYNSSKSKTFKQVKNPITTRVVFGSGPTEVVRGEDLVQVGPNGELDAPNAAIWMIKDHSIPFLQGGTFQVICGVGQKDYIPLTDEYGQPFHDVHPDKVMLKNMKQTYFATCFEKGSPLVPYPKGWMIFGSSEHPRLVQDPGFQKLKVVGKMHWTMLMKFVGPEGKGCKKDCAAIIDTGSTMLLLSPHAYEAIEDSIISKIPQDCEDFKKMAHTLPHFTFSLSGKKMSIPPELYVLNFDGQCMPAFQQISMGSEHGELSVLGMPFFRAYFTIFKRKAKASRIYVAPSSRDCRPMRYIDSQDRRDREVDTDSAGTAFPLPVNKTMLRRPLWLMDGGFLRD